MFWLRRVASWIFILVWISTWPASHADSNGLDCGIRWNIEYRDSLAVVWSGGVGNSKQVTIKINKNDKNDVTCTFAEDVTADATFSAMKIDVGGMDLCANTEFRIDVEFEDCTTYKSFKTVWTPPEPPLNVTIPENYVKNTSFMVSWDPPGGAGEIKHYSVLLNDTLFTDTTRDTQYWMENLNPFTFYKVQVSATNENFTGKPSAAVGEWTKVGVPSAPTSLTVSTLTNTSLFLVWKEPVPSVGPILSYEVECTDSDTKAVQSFVASENSYNITKLSAHTNYTIKVRAKTSAGTGPWTEAIKERTAIGVPSAPTGLTVSSLTHTSLFLVWKEPVPSVGPILSYDVECRDSDTQAVQSFVANKVSFNITKLAAYTNYTIKVRAKTSAGTGPWTEVIKERTAIGVPSAPTGLTVSSLTNTSLFLVWKEPVPSVGPILSYLVECTDSNTHAVQNFEITATKVQTLQTSFNVTDLASYTDYTLRVRAKTSAGTGPWTDVIKERTAIGVPSAPISLAIPSLTNTSLFLVWKAPVPSVGPILSYNVECRDSNAQAVQSSEIIETNGTSFNVTGLAPYTDYTLRVRAKTSAGTGPWTDVIKERTGIGVPYQPINFQYTNVTNTSVFLTWEEPRPVTGPILNYTVLCSDGLADIRASTMDTSFEVVELKPFTMYKVKVRASTAAGEGEWSDEKQLQTDIGVPSPPQNFRITSSTNTSIYLEWEEPTPDVGPIDHYTIRFTEPTMPDMKTNATFLNVTNLKPYTQYKLKASAATQAGQSNWTTEETVRTDVGVPRPPSKFNATSITNTSIYVKWEEPAPSTGPIVYYTIRCIGPAEKYINTTDTYFNITQLKPYTKYGLKVLAASEAGESNWTDEITVETPVGVPHSPTKLESISVTNTTLTLTWKEPSPSTGPIIDYEVLWNSSWDTQRIKTNSNVTSLVVNGLAPYTSYSFSVLAFTQAGSGKWSDSIIVHTEIGVPHEPTSLTKGPVTNTSVSLTWKEPVPSTGPILNYVVNWSSHVGTEGAFTRSNQTSYVVKGLLPYVKYTFWVMAETAAGAGGLSNYVFVQTGIGVPHAPTSLKKGLVTNTSVELSWKEPTPSTGPVLNYIVQWNLSTGPAELTVSSESASCIVDELLPHVTYAFKVLAVTAAGRGRWSEQITVLTKIGIPHRPTEVKSGSVTNTSIFLTWKEPSPSTGPIETYVVLWKSDRGGSTKETHSEKAFYNVTGLLPFVNYTFRVLARTAAGNGKWSVEAIIATDIGIPTVPRNLQLERVASASVAIRWRRPEYPNAHILSYQVQWHEADSNATVHTMLTVSNEAEVRLTIAGLPPFTEHSVRVSAVTGAGQGPWTEMLPFKTAVGVPQPAVFVDVLTNKSRTAFIKWSTRGPYPGPVDFSLQAWENPGLCSHRSTNFTEIQVTGTKTPGEWNTELHENEVTSLSPYGSYRFQIVLRTSATNGIWSDPSKEIRIAPEAAEEPADVVAECNDSPTEARVSWKAPSKPNGVIHSYTIRYKTENKEGSVTVPVSEPCRGSSYVLKGMQPERPIKISVFARVINVPSEGKSAQPKGVCTLPPGIPFVGNTSRVVAKESGSSYITLEWTKDAFSDYMGAIIHYSVFVGIKDTLGNASSGTTAESGPPWSNFSSGTSDFYQATPPLWNPFNTDADPLACKISLESTDGNNNRTILRCLVGSQLSCLENETYCNGPLKPDTQYEMKIRAFTGGGYTDTNVIYARTGPVPKPSNAGTVAAVVIFLILVVGLTTGGYVLKKKGHLGPWIEVIRARLKSKEGVSSKPANETPLEFMGQGTLPRPIKVKHFASHVRVMMNDSHLKFSQEFELLKNESPRNPHSVAEMEENRFKNRWMNIFPYDHSRVKLLPLCDEPGSDFINANYIPGISSPREYIATQGPLPHTVDDFWRMSWEQSVSMIVMLTQCVERGKKKCEQYWPDSGETRFFGDLKVTTTSESTLSSYIIRTFNVQLGSNERRIIQMHFTNWPDFGCPESPDELINFVRAVRDHLPWATRVPVLVHCSAGVGRTGTFIAVDRLMQQLRHSTGNELVDVYGTVLELRRHRTNMVQTEDQYIYIHLCVQQLIQERYKPPMQENQEQIYSNIGVINGDSGL